MVVRVFQSFRSLFLASEEITVSFDSCFKKHAMVEIPTASTAPSSNGVLVSAPMVIGEHVRAPMAAPHSQDLNPNLVANVLVDPMNPHFLHSSDSPRLVLVSTLLNECNYHFWS